MIERILLRSGIILAVLFPALIIPLSAQQFSPGAGDELSQRSSPTEHHQPGSRNFLFVENIGQWNPTTRLQGTLGDITVAFVPGRVRYSYRVDSLESLKQGKGTGGWNHFLSTTFIGARPNSLPEGTARTGAEFNYYLGAAASEHFLGAEAFEQVRYRDLYPGIDALYYSRRGALKYEFTVAPGSDYHRIALGYEGVEGLSVNEQGELEIRTAFGTVREAPPYSYQEINGRRVEVKSSYRVIDDTSFGFSLGAHNPKYPVTIDPCLSVEYSTYLGGGGYDVVTAMAVDSVKNAYAIGLTRAPDFPTVPRKDPADQLNYVFISKFAPDGTSLIYSTLIAETYTGGYGSASLIQTYEAIGEDVEVTPAGEAVVGLTTNISGLPTSSSAYMRDKAPNDLNTVCSPLLFENFDCYLVRFDPSGRLVWSTYLGGGDSDYLIDIALDPQGDVWMTGITYGPTCSGGNGRQGDPLRFPVTEPVDAFAAPDQGTKVFETFVSRLSSDGGALPFSAFYGGDGNEFAGRIALDGQGKVYIVGSTNSGNLKTTSNAYRSTPEPGLTQSVYDVYIARIDPATRTLEYSSYFPDNGGNGRRGLGFGGYLPRSTYSTILGFDRPDRRMGLLMGGQPGEIIFAGTTRSTGLPTTPGAVMGSARNPNAQATAANDCYLVRFNVENNNIRAATYLGGSNLDGLGGIAYDAFGNVVVAALTYSTDFPITPITLYERTETISSAAVAVLAPNFNNLEFSTYIGGEMSGTYGKDYYLIEHAVNGITGGSDGALYLFGGTTSHKFPLTPEAVLKENDYFGGFVLKFAPPGAASIGTATTRNFPPEFCNDLQYESHMIFNAGQQPLVIDSIALLDGRSFAVTRPEAFPFSLAACDTLYMTIRFDPATAPKCDSTIRDTVLIYSAASQGKPSRVAVSGRRSCIAFELRQTAIVDSNYKMGSEGAYNFVAFVGGVDTQYVTIEPVGDGGSVFKVEPPHNNFPYTRGTAALRFEVTATDTGWYCGEFDVTIQPCNRRERISICSYVRSPYVTVIPDSINLGTVSCTELSHPISISNTGNDTLRFRVYFVGGEQAGDIEFDRAMDPVRRLLPGETFDFSAVFKPRGIGDRNAVIVLETNSGFEDQKYPRIPTSMRLDSVAFRLSIDDMMGAYGDLMSIPINYEPLYEEESPVTDLSFFIAFNPTMLDVQEISLNGTLAQGWEVVDRMTVPDSGAVVRIRMKEGGNPIAGAGVLANLRVRVLRGDTIETPLDIALTGISQGCMTAVIDSGEVAFRLSPECLAYERLLFNNTRILKPTTPNPASGSTLLAFRVPEGEGDVRIALYDALGREVMRPIDGPLNPGEFVVEMDVSALPPGRYFVRMTVGTLVNDVQEMVIER